MWRCGGYDKSALSAAHCFVPLGASLNFVSGYDTEYSTPTALVSERGWCGACLAVLSRFGGSYSQGWFEDQITLNRIELRSPEIWDG